MPGHKFQPGQSGNPAGRPKKGETLSDILRDTLETKVTTSGGRKKMKELFVAKALDMAINSRDEGTRLRATEFLWRYHDNLPESMVHLKMTDETAKKLSEIFKKK